MSQATRPGCYAIPSWAIAKMIRARGVDRDGAPAGTHTGPGDIDTVPVTPSQGTDAR